MDDSNDVLAALEEFCEKQPDDIPCVLSEHLKHVAATGLTQFPWPKLKVLVARKLDDVIKDFQKISTPASCIAGVNSDSVSFDLMRCRLIDSVQKFTSAPFTIQRLCELLVTPTKHYKTIEKFMRGIERTLLVVSTVDPCGNRITREPFSLQSVHDNEAPVPWATPYPVGLSPCLPAVPESQVETPPFPSPWLVGRPPSPFDSPSLRGCAPEGSRRRRSFRLVASLDSSKRLRVDVGSPVDGGPECFSPVDPAESAPVIHSPILGQLLSDPDNENINDVSASTKMMQRHNLPCAFPSVETSDASTIRTDSTLSVVDSRSSEISLDENLQAAADTVHRSPVCSIDTPNENLLAAPAPDTMDRLVKSFVTPDEDQHSAPDTMDTLVKPLVTPDDDQHPAPDTMDGSPVTFIDTQNEVKSLDDDQCCHTGPGDETVAGPDDETVAGPSDDTVAGPSDDTVDSDQQLSVAETDNLTVVANVDADVVEMMMPAKSDVCLINEQEGCTQDKIPVETKQLDSEPSCDLLSCFVDAASDSCMAMECGTDETAHLD